MNPTPTRIFRIGNVTIHEDESTANLSIEEVRSFLSLQYPEVENATVVEQESEAGILINFLNQPGRKG